jgi:hypothetical protein
MTDAGNQAGDGSQAGWYTVGGAIGTAGVTIWSVGFSKSPPSEELESLGLIFFIIGLFLIVTAMPSLHIRSKLEARSARHSTRARRSTALNPRLILTAVSALAAILIGNFVIFSDQPNAGRHDSAPKPASDITPFSSMTVGACVDLSPGDNKGARVVNCTDPHDAELDSTQQAESAGPSTIVSLECQDSLNELSLSASETIQSGGFIDYTVPTAYFYVYPSVTDVASGDREYYCFFKAGKGQQSTGFFPP